MINKRISEELVQFQRDPLTNISADPLAVKDLYNWTASNHRQARQAPFFRASDEARVARTAVESIIQVCKID